MFDVFAKCATDPVLEVQGTWREIGDGSEILVARANNRNYSKLLNKLYTEHQEVLDRDDDAADAKSDEIMVQVFAETILLGWKKLGYQGSVIDYSVENAKKLLRHADFRVLVGRKSGEFDAYKLKVEDEQGKA